MKTRNRRYPRSSGMDGDKSGESGVFLFSRRAQISSMVNDHSRQMKTQICTVGDVGRWISLITNPLRLLGSNPPITRLCTNFNFWRTFHFQIQYRENLGQTSGDYPIIGKIMGRSAKSKIPDRLGFSRHMKTRLKWRVTYRLDAHVPYSFRFGAKSYPL